MQDIVKTGEKAPDGRARLMLYLTVGLVQGLLLAVLTRNDRLLILYFAWLMPILMLAILLPQALYYSEAAAPGRRRGIVCAAAIMAVVIGVYQGATFSAGHEFHLAAALALSLLLFIGAPALSVQTDWRAARYPQWVDAALRAFGLLAQGGLILGLAWIAFAAADGLFSLLGMRWVRKTIFSAWFSFPFNCLVFAWLAAQAGLDDSMAQRTLARCMRLCGWLYPMMAGIGILFVASWIGGIEALLRTGRAATILLWFLALLIFFFNLHTRCGLEARPAKWLRWIAAAGWIAALPMLAVALYGLGLRIEQYGLSEERIWGLLAACIIAIFVLGYCAHAAAEFFRPEGAGRTLSRTHLAASLALAVSVLTMFSGIADPRRISVQSQWRQWAQQRTSDWEFKRFLKYKGGVFGEDALRELEARAKDANDPLARQAQALLDSQEEGVDASADLLRAMKVFPGEETAPDGLIEAWASSGAPKACRVPSNRVPSKDEPACLIWKFRPGKDAPESYTLLVRNGGASHNRTAKVWQEVRPGNWDIVASLEPECRDADAREALFAAVIAGSARFAPPERSYDDILAGNVRIMLSPSGDAKRECGRATP
ncbi:MAG: DUF4153 domain-containing protein [Azoarcus sp.]|jgi:hypothetical protein|nr:DUF4153 domain-containing protein [Azoarcus sp.]